MARAIQGLTQVATKPEPGREAASAQAPQPRIADAGVQRMVCLDWQDLAGRSAEWDRLAEDASEPNPFLESWYLLPALRAFRDKRVQVLCYEEDGRLRGLLPIQFCFSYYGRPIPHISTWIHGNCFLGVPLVARGAEVAFWRSMLAWADAEPGTALFLHLKMLTIGGAVHAALDAVLATQVRRNELVLRNQRALLESGLTPEQYWEGSLSAKKRKELRRQANRLAEHGELAFARTTGSDGLERWTGEFLALEAAGWKGHAGSSLATSAATASLFCESLAGAARRGRLERLSLTLDARPIAMLANFLTPPGAFSFKTTFDESFARFSPGVLLQQHNLAMLNRPEIAWTDSCASEGHPMIDHIWRERRAIGHISIAIGGHLRRSLFGRLVDIETRRKPGDDAP